MASFSLNAFVSSVLLVAISEMGDKTQLLAFSLTSRYRRPLPIMAGILAATILNHGLAALVGVKASEYISPTVMSWVLAITFFGCAIWALFPDKLEEGPQRSAGSVFLTTTLVFFVAEMGDKTQLATVALAARYSDIVMVTIGTTVGMMLTNALAVFAGERLAWRMQSKWVRWFAAALFLVFAAVSAVQALWSNR